MNLRRGAIVFLLGMLAILIQGALLRAFSPHMVVPSFVLILVIFLAFYETSVLGVCMAFLLGLLLDMCGGIVVGPWAGSFVLVFATVAVLSQRIFVEAPLAVMVTVFFASLASNGVYGALLYQVSRSAPSSAWTLLVEALMTAILCPLCFSGFKKLLIKKERPGSVRRYSFVKSTR